MSKRKVEGARLKNSAGPFFPESLTSLHDLLYGDRSHVHTALDVEEAFKGHGQYQSRRDNLMTSDGYRWFSFVVFRVDGERVIVGLPWAAAKPDEDGQTSERHCAVYVQGQLRVAILEEFIKSLTVHLQS